MRPRVHACRILISGLTELGLLMLRCRLSAFLHSGSVRWVAEDITNDLPNARRLNIESGKELSVEVGTPDRKEINGCKKGFWCAFWK